MSGMRGNDKRHFLKEEAFLKEIIRKLCVDVSSGSWGKQRVAEMQTTGKYVFLLVIVTPSHTQPLPYITQTPTPRLTFYYKEESLGKRPQDDDTPSPTRLAQLRAERKGAEPERKGRGKGRTEPKTDTGQGSRIRHTETALVPPPGPSDRCRTHLLHVTTAPTLPASVTVPLHGPGNSTERKEIPKRRDFRR